jgi:hypothetical protein
MGKKRHIPEQIINKLREAEVELARGMKVPEVCDRRGSRIGGEPSGGAFACRDAGRAGRLVQRVDIPARVPKLGQRALQRRLGSGAINPPSLGRQRGAGRRRCGGQRTRPHG